MTNGARRRFTLSQLLAHPSFIILVVLLVITALGFTLAPLILGDPQHRSLRRRRQALDALRDELEPGDYGRRVAKLEQQLDAGRQGPPLPRGLVGLLLVAVPLLALFLYTEVGTPEGLRKAGGVDAEMREALGDLADRVNTDPLDLESWTQIGVIWKSMRQFGVAEAAFRRVLFHDPANATAIVELAETLLFSSAQPHLPTEARQLLDGLLQREPDHPKALWLSGFNAMQLGNTAVAIDYWTRLEELLPEGSVRDQVRNQLRQARSMPMDEVHGGLLTGAASGRESSAAEDALDDGTVPAPVAGSAQPRPRTASNLAPPPEPGGAVAGESLVTVEVAIAVAPELAERLSGQETVFVFARAVNGPPAPLAVKRFSVRELPTQVVLSEADAMAAGLTLAAFPQVRIVARISRSGGVIAAPGDLEGGTEALDPRAVDQVSVMIDQVIGDAD